LRSFGSREVFFAGVWVARVRSVDASTGLARRVQKQWRTLAALASAIRSARLVCVVASAAVFHAALDVVARSAPPLLVVGVEHR